MLRRDFQRLALARVADAKVLFAAGRYDAAYYLAGLAVECALKARVAQATIRYEFPDRRTAERAFTHDLKKLLELALLKRELEQAPLSVQKNWDVVSTWSVEVRYGSGTDADECRKLLHAVAERGGILPWLKQWW
ncbi:HEPN domain-containing protein [Rhodopila globiformis]|uniref:HEPN domain-containing protein n=1 Tax=Rhodopila globiformis TaxID=1071 RepID=A0A2S6N1H0_RHOGL|nr:HEPN domain-containing protein [Rhodopila globiformis]PPQ28440.1 hypothetical protein CCS01_24190 [Rhodopila globiformis]